MATAPVPSWYLPGSPADVEYQRQLALNPNLPRPLQLGGAAGNVPSLVAPGALPGTPGTGGSPAAGRIPPVPDPTTTQAGALAGNLANLAKLRQLFNKVSNIAGITPGMTADETSLIKNLQNAPSFLGGYPDLARTTAEWGAGQGVSGSPAETTLGYRLTDEERLRRQLLGSKLLTERAGRANTILPLKEFMQTPEGRQFWTNLANTLTNAPDPEAAFRRAMDLLKTGLNRGLTEGYGGGAPRITTPSGTTTPNPLTIPGWPTIPPPPTTTPGRTGGPPSVFAPPPKNYDAAEEWLRSLGLGLNSPGVTTTPTNSFIGDINPPEDIYA